MLGKLEYIEIGDKKYPLAFSFNVMEQVQETYGTMDAWTKTLQADEGRELKMKDLIWTFQQFVNEGIEIENEDNNQNRPLMTHKQVGRLITQADMKKLVATMKSMTVKSIKSDDPNVKTTQNQTDQ